jgi:predicted dehydrogenase
MLNIGIIGCGRITQVRHAPEYTENPHCRIIGFYDVAPERAEAMAAEYGGRAFATLAELLDSGVDAVSVCSANTDHAQATIAALEKGIHVLCEKPMATTLQDCERMVEAARRAGKLLMLGHNQRFAKAHVEARRLIQAGVLGKVLAFHTTFGHPGPEGWTGQANSWFFDRSRAAFGVLADLGIHKTDLIHYLLGEPIVKVSARIATLDKKYPDGAPIDVDDNAYCLYETAGGATGTLHVSWTFYGQEDNSTRLYGTEGSLRLYDDPEASVILERRDGSIERMQLDRMTTNQEQTTGGRTSTGVIDAFVHSILTGEPPIIDGAEALRAMRVIFAADQSSKEGRVVSIRQA